MAWVQAEAYRTTAKYLISLGITNFADIIIEHEGVQSDFETGDSTGETKSDKSDTQSEKSKEKSKGRTKGWGEFRSIRTDLSALKEKEIADLEGQIELQRAIKKGALSERHKLTKEFSPHMDNISRIIAAAELEIKALQKRQWLIMYTYPQERQV